MTVRKSADLSELTAETPEIQTAVDQLDVTRPQDFGRVFLPGADQEMAEAIASIVTTEGDVQAAMDGLKETLRSEERRVGKGWRGRRAGAGRKQTKRR